MNLLKENLTLIVLLIGILFSMMSGVLFSSTGLFFEPYLLVWLGIILYVNLIQLNPNDLKKAFINPKKIIILSITKLLIIPIFMFIILFIFEPELALPIVLLSGISTGLGAPFVINFIGGKLSEIIGIITITSILVTFTLPFMIFLLFQEEFNIPIMDMIIILVLAQFLPLILGWLTKKFVPNVKEIINKFSTIISFIFIILINFTMFAIFSDYFFQDISFVITNIIIASMLFTVYGLIGYFVVITINRKKEITKEDKITGFTSMAYINNIIIAVFALEFFSIEVAALAVFYNIPYYFGILILKKIYSMKNYK
ncbi:MAG: bile acid:sodium symporter [Nitrososphaeraceae archaeon]